MRPLVDLLLTFALVAPLALPGPAGAQGAPAPAGRRADEQAARDIAKGEKTGVYGGQQLTPSDENVPRLKISIVDAIATGVQNNLSVEVQRYNPLIAEQAADAAWGAYDPSFSADIGYLDSTVPRTSLLAPDDVKQTDGVGGLSGLIPILGGGYSITLGGDEDRQDSFITTLNPKYTTEFLISADIPLLKDLLHHEAWLTIETSALQRYSSLDAFRSDLIDVVFGIESGYWRVVATAEQLRVARKSLETAQALLDQTETQYEVGVVSRVEVVQAEAGVADREFRLIVADAQHRDAQDILLDLVYGTRLRADTRVKVVTTDDPEDYVTYEIDPEASVQKAFIHRPDLAIARRTEEENQISLRYAKNQRLPSLDVQVSYGLTGIAGEPPQNSIGPSYGDTFKNMGNNPTTTVRGLFSIPIPNTAARKQVRISKFQLRQSKSQTKQLEQSIIVSVRKAARDLGASQRGIVAAERARVASAEQLRAERIRLEHGESTPFDVLLKEETLVQAESQKIAALETYRNAIAALDREQGTTLESRNIQFDQVLGAEGPDR